MYIEIKNCYTNFKDLTTKEENFITDWCTVRYPYWQRVAGKSQLKVRQLCYFKKDSLPTGWVPQLLREGKEKGIFNSLSIKDFRQEKNSVLNLKGALFPLRPEYQLEAVADAVKIGRGIIHHCTGSGKTVIMSHLIEKIDKPTLILVPSLNLLNQNYNEMCNFFGEDKVGKIGEGEWDPQIITIATVQTLWSMMKNKSNKLKGFFKSLDLLLIEEAHHINTGSYTLQNSYFKVCMHINAYYRFGLTATPGKEASMERKLLEAVTGRVFHTASSSNLIRWGYLTQPWIKMVHIDLPTISDWRSAYEHNILKNTERNSKIAQIAQYYAKQGKSVLITVTRVSKHGQVLLDLLPDAEFMYGKTPSEERERILNDFKDKKFHILISTVVNEGVNIPAMDVIILAGGGKSDKMTVQRIGRVLRKSDLKSEAVIIDFFDKDASILEKHSKTRLKIYKKEEQYEIDTNAIIII